MLLRISRRSMNGMNRNNVITVIRVTIALVCWFAAAKLYGVFIDPLLEGVLPDHLRMILSSMVVPYTIGLVLFFIVTAGMARKDAVDIAEGEMIKPDAWKMVKFFVIQTGLSYPCMVAASIVSKIFGFELSGITSDELFGNLWFYIALLLVFNPVFEELLFRKFVLERLGCLGMKGAVICSAVMFSLPHVISQGPAQMLYTFALGLVWAYVTVKTGKLWPAVVLHSLSNVYGAFIPMALGKIHPLASAPFVMLTMMVMLPLTIIMLTKKKEEQGTVTFPPFPGSSE